MDTIELGKKRAEEFITEQMRSLDRDSGMYALLWWTPDPLDPDRESTHAQMTVPLRLYKGNSWRLVKFSKSDLDDCAKSPELLQKYEEEIRQALMDL